MASLVKFASGKFANLPASRDASTIYFCNDTHQIFLGDAEYTKGTSVITAEPTASTVGDTGHLYAYNGNLYLCTGVVDGEYQYVRVANVNDESNTIEGIKVNGDALTPDASKNVDITIATGTKDGFISVNGKDVELKGIKDAIGVTEAGAFVPVETTVANAISELNATKTQTAGADGLALSITEANGVITGFSGSIAANTYDAYGAAADVQGDTDETVASVDTKVAAINDATTGILATAKNYTDAEIKKLDASVQQEAGDDGLALSITEVDGKITAIAGSIAENTYDAYGAAQAVADTLGTAAAANVATVPIGTTSEDDDALPTVSQVETYVTDSIKDLSGAMHFVGAATPTEGQTDIEAITALYPSGKSPKSGDFAIITTNGLEYVYSGSTWNKLGDELTYVTKSTTIAGVDLENNITKAELLTALNVADGAQVNVLEGVQVAGTDLTIDGNKKVNVTLGSFGITATASDINDVTNKVSKSGDTITGDLEVSGTVTSTFEGNLTGDVTGNADTATKATQDAAGNVITTTYATKAELTWQEF